MATPAYTTDLTLINNAENGTWAEITGYTSGQALTNNDTDYYIQGSGCTSIATAGKTGLKVGFVHDYGSAITFAAGEVLIAWHVLLMGNAMETFANGGLRIGMGSSNGNMNFWYVGGSDFGRNPQGGWEAFAIDPTHTADWTIGSPNGNLQWFGNIPNLASAISKGNPLAMDAMYYGRGDLQSTLGNLGDGFCTFDGMSAENDLNSNRWGLFQNEGGSFTWQGLMSIGTAAASAQFVDSNQVINVNITPNVYSDFNKIEINNTGTFVSWDNILITSLETDRKGPRSPGSLEVVDNPAGESGGLKGVNLESCVFTDMTTFVFQSNCYINNTTFRRCGTVSQGGGIFDGCLFDESPSGTALLVDNIDNIDNCQFTSTGTGHAIELTSDHIQGGVYTLEGTLFTDYATVSGGTGNEAIYNNSGNYITINIVNGGDYPTVKNGAGASTKIVQAVTYTLTGIVSGSEVQIVTQDAYDDGTVNSDEDLYHLENTTIDDGSGRGTTQATYTYSYTADIDIYVYLHKLGYEWTRITDTLISTNKSVPVSQKIDRVYDNP